MSIELAKEFGGTDGHKYVNAVLNTLARQLREAEVNADRSWEASQPLIAGCHENFGTRPGIEPFYVMRLARRPAPWRSVWHRPTRP